MIWAILLASATATSFLGFRASNPSSQLELDGRPALATRTTEVAPTTRSCRNLSLPALLIRPRRCLTPVDRSRGVKSS